MRWRIDYVNYEQMHESEDSSVDEIVTPKPGEMHAAGPLCEIVEADRFERLGSQWVATKKVLVIGQPREIVVRRIHANRVARVMPLDR